MSRCRPSAPGCSTVSGSLARASPGISAATATAGGSPLPPPRLLGAFEPLLLGWVSREPVLGDDPAAIVTGGMFRGFALVGGRGVAGWRLKGGAVEITPFAPVRS